METFTEITSEQANVIGEFEYAPNKIFSPFVGKQTNGNFIVSKEMYDMLKDTEQFQRVSWDGEWKTIDKLDFEEIKK